MRMFFDSGGSTITLIMSGFKIGADDSGTTDPIATGQGAGASDA